MGTDIASALACVLAAASGGGLAGSQVSDEEISELIESLYGVVAARARLAILRMFCGEGHLRIEAERAFGDDESAPTYDVKMILTGPDRPTITLSVSPGATIPKGQLTDSVLSVWVHDMDPRFRANPSSTIYELLSLSRRFITAHSRDFRYGHHMVEDINLKSAAADFERDGALDGLLTMQPGDGAFSFTLLDSHTGRSVACTFDEDDIPTAVDLSGQQVLVRGRIEFSDGGPVAVKVGRIRRSDALRPGAAVVEAVAPAETPPVSSEAAVEAAVEAAGEVPAVSVDDAAGQMETSTTDAADRDAEILQLQLAAEPPEEAPAVHSDESSTGGNGSSEEVAAVAPDGAINATDAVNEALPAQGAEALEGAA